MQDILELQAQNINLTWLFDLVILPKYPFSLFWSLISLFLPNIHLVSFGSRSEEIKMMLTPNKKKDVISHALSATQCTSYSRSVLCFIEWLFLLLSGSFIGKILAHCFYGFFDSSLASKQALCPVLAGEGWRLGERRNWCLLLELGWNLFLSLNEVLVFSLKKNKQKNPKWHLPPPTKKPNYGCINMIILGTKKTPKTSSTAACLKQSPLQNFEHFLIKKCKDWLWKCSVNWNVFPFISLFFFFFEL